jgi:hypothetical protein
MADGCGTTINMMWGMWGRAMLLNLTVSDAKGAQQGSAQLFLDWGPIPRWYLEKESPAGLPCASQSALHAAADQVSE